LQQFLWQFGRVCNVELDRVELVLCVGEVE
jgi:hypothetical protein